jgi:hypothetical protein
LNTIPATAVAVATVSFVVIKNKYLPQKEVKPFRSGLPVPVFLKSFSEKLGLGDYARTFSINNRVLIILQYFP